MNRNKILTILCNLKYCDEYTTYESEFEFEFDDRVYCINFERKNGMVTSFTVEDIGDCKRRLAIGDGNANT